MSEEKKSSEKRDEDRDAEPSSSNASQHDSPRSKLPRESSHTAVPNNSRTNLMVAASPPKFVSFDEIMKAANGVQNMSLAHEIAVDNDFRFQKVEHPQNSMWKQVHDVMHRAFWDAMQAKLDDDPPDYSPALSLLSEIKELLGELILPQQQNLRSYINEMIDLDLVKQQVENGSLDFRRYATTVIDFMARMCAPERDGEVARLRELDQVVPLYREMMQVLDNMKMDMANFTIQQMRPYIQQQSVNYERTKFDQFLKQQQENGVDGLEATRSWLQRAALNLATRATPPSTSTGPEKTDTVSPSSSDVPPSSSSTSMSTEAPSPNALLNTAYLELIEWPENLLYPETLLMDEKRFHDVGVKVQWLTLVASVIMVTYSTVGAPIAGVSDLKAKLKQHLADLLTDVHPKNFADVMANISSQVEKDVCLSLEERGFPARSEDTMKLLKGQVEATVNPTHPVHALIKSRLLSFLEVVISQRSTTSLQLPAGFSALSDELSHVSGQFSRLVSYNRSVFGPHYSDIIKGILQNLPQDQTE